MLEELASISHWEHKTVRQKHSERMLHHRPLLLPQILLFKIDFFCVLIVYFYCNFFIIIYPPYMEFYGRRFRLRHIFI